MRAGTSAHDDLRYARELAEQGARAPLIGGRLMMWWGALVAAAYVAQHFALAGGFGAGGAPFGFIWMTFGIVGGIGHFMLQRGLRDKAGSGSAGNRAAPSVWGAAALSIASMVMGLVVAVARGAAPTLFDWIVPLAFAVYACALIVTGSLAGSRVTVTAGSGAALMVGVFAAMIFEPGRYLIAAFGAAVTVFLPGLLLLRAEPPARG